MYRCRFVLCVAPVLFTVRGPWIGQSCRACSSILWTATENAHARSPRGSRRTDKARTSVPAASSKAHQREPTGADSKVKLVRTVAVRSHGSVKPPSELEEEAHQDSVPERRVCCHVFCAKPAKHPSAQGIRRPAARFSQKERGVVRPKFLMNVSVMCGDDGTPQCVSQA